MESIEKNIFLENKKTPIFLFLLYICYFLFSFIENRKDLYFFILLIPLSVLYLIISNIRDNRNNFKYVLIGILFRLATIGNYPFLSDDWHRFVWDGYLTFNSINPYSYSPTIFLEQNPTFLPVLNTSYWYMNSRDFYSVYPPILQSVFSLPWLLKMEDNPVPIYRYVLLLMRLCHIHKANRIPSKWSKIIFGARDANSNNLF